MDEKKVKLTVNIDVYPEDFKRLFQKGYSDGISFEELFEIFIGDLAGGNASCGSDESLYASRWYDRHIFYAPEKKTFVRYLIENEWADPNDFSEMLHGIDIYMDAYDECKNDSDEEGMKEYREYILADVEEIHDLYRAYHAECDGCDDLREALAGVCEYTIKQNKLLGGVWEMYDLNEDYWNRFCGYVKELEEMESKAE
ncbi:MAG: hypothetical protein IJ794_11370 [Lachnospiraceae bacterium]|nr:hypothetical protein [Lachnospiraceae bacterium]